MLAGFENCTSAEIRLITVAAIFHDIGFLISPENVETQGCIVVRDELPELGFTDKEIDRIRKMTTATRINQYTVIQFIHCFKYRLFLSEAPQTQVF